jgi:hypothetical protein
VLGIKDDIRNWIAILVEMVFDLEKNKPILFFIHGNPLHLTVAAPRAGMPFWQMNIRHHQAKAKVIRHLFGIQQLGIFQLRRFLLMTAIGRDTVTPVISHPHRGFIICRPYGLFHFIATHHPLDIISFGWLDKL